MKKTVVLAVMIGMACIGCKKPIKRVPSGGIYELIKQTVNDGKRDSVFPVRQYKIYSDRYYMYAATGPDSLVLFGVGSYRPDTNSTIATHNIFGSHILDSAQDFHIRIFRTDSSYTEFNPKRSATRRTNYKMTEIYRTLKPRNGSKLDGLWWLYRVKSGQSKAEAPHDVSYQMFYQGYFIAGTHHVPVGQDRKPFNEVYFGDFELQNDSLREQIKMAGNSKLINQQIAVKLTFNGKNEFSIIHTDPVTGASVTEIYVRAAE